MPPGLLSGWVTGWKLRKGTAAYVASLFREPSDADVQWLASAATGGDTDRARWELRYARRALGLLVAERDALDDRTGSMVSRELRAAMSVDRNIAADMVRVAERQFSDRLGRYREVLAARNADEPTGARLGQTLLRAARPDALPEATAIERAGELLVTYLGGANESLRNAFGAASLPPDQPPSAFVKGQPH
jgi:hypothetical protein